MKKLNYQVYQGTPEEIKAVNPFDKNNVVVEGGSFIDGYVVNPEFVTIGDNDKLEKIEVLGEFDLVNISKVNLDLAIAGYPNLAFDLTCNGGEELVSITVPVSKIVEFAVENELTGTLCEITIGGDTINADIVYIDFTNGNISYRDREHVDFVPDFDESWWISYVNSLIDDSEGLYPLFLSYAKAVNPNVDSIESVGNMNEDYIIHSLCSTAIEKHRVIK